MNYSLENKLAHLRDLRNTVKALKDDYAKERIKFIESVKDLNDRIDGYTASLLETEQSIKEEALKLYQEGDKSSKDIYRYLKERDLTILHYKEEDALEWAKKHELFLDLNAKAFESYIRNLKGKGVPSFVRIEVKETVVISSEL